MVTNKEKLDIYVGMLENLLEEQALDSAKVQELALELEYALDLKNYPAEELDDDSWFQEHVLKELV